jgi:xanthine dehydrogenase accessory factor
MKHSILKKIVDLKKQKKEFAIVTNLKNSNSVVYKLDEDLDEDFIQYKDQIDSFFKLKNNGVIDGTDIFVETYIRPIKVIIVGAVHIAQYLVDFAKSLNFEITIIDPRGYFASEKRFPNVKIINLWPQEAFQHCPLNEKTALIALTHDPKIDDPAIQEALNKKCFYIGALGSKKTHENRCKRLTENGFKADDIKKIFGPIGIKFGGRSAPEIALSIIFQLMTEIYKK